MTIRTWIRLVSSAAAVALSAGLMSMAAAVPTAISYVGKLETAAGPVDAQVDVSVTLYDAATGGNVVWGPQLWDDHAANGGVLKLLIGGSSMPSLDAALQTHDALWAEFSINGEILGNRHTLGAAPFAIVAQNAQRLGGIDASEYVTNAAFAAAAAAAAHSPTAPASPSAGQLWFSTTDQTMYAWDSGSSSWVGVSVGDASPSDLPPNGIDKLSSSMLTNTFNNVSHLNNTPADIADAGIAGPGQAAVQDFVVAEASGSYITGVTILTNFNLTSGNDIEVKLIPPVVLGAGDIILSDGLLTFGPYGQVWTTDTTPELSGLLQKNPSGTWTLAVTDKDDNLDNNGTNVAGTLNSFELRYNVVRSNHVASNGVLEVDNINVSGTLTADSADSLLVDNKLNVDGMLRVQGELARRIQRWEFDTQVSANNAEGINYTVPGRTVTFTKFYDDTTLRINYQENIYPGDTSTNQLEFIFDGMNCAVPHRNIYYFDWDSSNSGGLNYGTHNFIGFCKELDAGGGNTVGIAAGEHTFQVKMNRTQPTFGWSDEEGLLIIEEIY